MQLCGDANPGVFEVERVEQVDAMQLCGDANSGVLKVERGGDLDGTEIILDGVELADDRTCTLSFLLG